MHRPPLSPRWIACVVLLCSAPLAGQTAAYGQPPPDMKINTATKDPIFGTSASFYLEGNYNSWSVTSTKWEYQYSTATGTVPWSEFGATQSIALVYPGTLSVRCTQVYNNGSGGKTLGPTTLAVYTMTVPPPDGFRVLNPTATGRFGQDITIVFQVTCKGKDSFYFSAIAQEKNDNFKYFDGTGRLKGNWRPTIAEFKEDTRLGIPHRFYYRGSGQIVDLKQQNSGGPRDTVRVAPGNTVVTFDQSVGVIILDPQGNPLGTVIDLKSKPVTVTVSPTDPTSVIITHPN